MTNSCLSFCEWYANLVLSSRRRPWSLVVKGYSVSRVLERSVKAKAARFLILHLRLWLARIACAYTYARSIGFCVSWVCIISSSSSICYIFNLLVGKPRQLASIYFGLESYSFFQPCNAAHRRLICLQSSNEARYRGKSGHIAESYEKKKKRRSLKYPISARRIKWPRLIA